MTVLKWVLLIVLSYALGNISVARIISRIKKDDITKHGSGNPGTMNMIRTFGIGTGLLTLFFDCLKGAIPALAGMLLFRADGEIMANTAL
ncbi:MAG: glycerol-3-phosphate acyltransferase, partial [Christensenellales bacterium]